MGRSDEVDSKEKDGSNSRGRGSRHDHENDYQKKKKRKHEKDDDKSDDDTENDEDDDDDDKRRRDRKRERSRKESKSRRRKKESSSSRRKKKKHHNSSSKKRKRRRHRSSSSDDDSTSSSSSSDSSTGSSSSSDDERDSKSKFSHKEVIANEKLLAKLNARGETLEERKERRAQKRAAKIQARFGYTAEDNPFNDLNLHETFTWTKKKEKTTNASTGEPVGKRDTIEEIETIRRRRKEREIEREEMERLRAEESRMKELENYDEWAKKEEEFHLEQQRKRSAIRLVEGREKPVDVLAKNLLLFGLTEEEKKHRAAVKYQERYNALDELQKLDAELEEPHKIVGVLKLVELQELLEDIDAFRLLEKEAMGESGNTTIIMYWEALSIVVKDEIKLLQNGGENRPYSKKIEGIKSIFESQSRADLMKMKEEVNGKIRKAATPEGADIDRGYWISVLEQLIVHIAKMDLSELHSKMLVRQLEKLEQRKEVLAKQQKMDASTQGEKASENEQQEQDMAQSIVPKNVQADFGNLEEELGLADEVALAGNANKSYSWQDRYMPRKPRYFNRVRTGFDWNKYNQTHYDSENPPPKIVQGYKFNIFYPDLVDPTKTPQYFLEPVDNDFCILRFNAGPPYEDIAFKIINREWNKSRKRGFRSTFERGVLSLYFNFTTHWYRR